MRYAILSDVHANAEALRRVLDDAAAQGAERVVCLGDVVGYGPLPAETLALVRRSAALTLAGNHDDAVSGRGDASSFVGLAQDAVRRHREALAAADLNWLRSLPHAGEIEGALLAHGDFADPPKFYYVEDEKDARANFDATDAQLMFVGHTHVPGLFLLGASGTVYKTEPQDFALEDGKRYIVNPGSVGYPREHNGGCYSSYVLYDTESRSVTFRFLPFSVASVMQRGATRNRLRKRLLAGLVATAAILAGALAYFCHPGAKVIEKKEVVFVAAEDDPALLLARKGINLRAADKVVHANLQVSDPVLLSIVFKNANGQVVGSESGTVRRSSKKPFKIPTGALSAEFKVRKATPDAPAQITAFAPTAAPK